MKNNIADNLRKTATVLFVCFICLLIYITYLQVWKSRELTANPLNRRFVELEKRIERGEILDRNGEKLAYSEKLQSVFHRRYPYGAITSHVTGYSSSKYGNSSVEAMYNEYLSGIINPERRLGPIASLWETTRGNNIMLTLDVNLQTVAYKALGAQQGAVVVLSPKTGEILALVSKPGFDPEDIDKNWGSLSSSLTSPLLNRAVQGLYPPGSILKVIVAETALSEKVVDTKKNFLCNGQLQIGTDYTLTEANHKAHGKVNLEEALAVSCNVTFGQLTLQLGRDKVTKMFDRYGVSRPAAEELGEVASRVPNISKLGEGDLAQVGIGQGSLLVTPLKMAMIAAAFANQGVMMKPYILKQIISPEGTNVLTPSSAQWASPVSPALAETLKKMMVSVVDEGTGGAAALGSIKVAGKTGTAENPHGAPHAWFIGFAPADKPEVAIAVVVQNGGSGGAVAAPIARQVLAQALY